MPTLFKEVQVKTGVAQAHEEESLLMLSLIS
jgi:hypothetical protein